MLAPPLCAACGRPCPTGEVVCGLCARRLAEAVPLRGSGPHGLDRAWSSAPHEGVARDLVAALKFRRLLPVAGLIAARIDELAPPSLGGGAIVPVPTAPARSAIRGFDPAAEIADGAGPISAAPRCGRDACGAPGAAASWAGAGPSASGGRPGSRPTGRRRAALCSSTTC